MYKSRNVRYQKRTKKGQTKEEVCFDLARHHYLIQDLLQDTCTFLGSKRKPLHASDNALVLLQEAINTSYTRYQHPRLHSKSKRNKKNTTQHNTTKQNPTQPSKTQISGNAPSLTHPFASQPRCDHHQPAQLRGSTTRCSPFLLTSPCFFRQPKTLLKKTLTSFLPPLCPAFPEPQEQAKTASTAKTKTTQRQTTSSFVTENDNKNEKQKRKTIKKETEDEKQNKNRQRNRNRNQKAKNKQNEAARPPIPLSYSLSHSLINYRVK